MHITAGLPLALVMMLHHHCRFVVGTDSDVPQVYSPMARGEIFLSHLNPAPSTSSKPMEHHRPTRLYSPSALLFFNADVHVSTCGPCQRGRSVTSSSTLASPTRRSSTPTSPPSPRGPPHRCPPPCGPPRRRLPPPVLHDPSHCDASNSQHSVDLKERANSGVPNR